MLVAVACAASLAACTKYDHDTIVPDSLPYSANQIGVSGTAVPRTIDTFVGFDSLAGGDRITRIFNEADTAALSDRPRGMLLSGIGSFMAEVEHNFSALRFPGLRHVSLLAHDFDTDGNGVPDDVFLLSFADSDVLYGLNPTDVWSSPFLDLALPAKQGEIDYHGLAVWHPRSDGRRLLVFRGASTVLARDRFLDTLYFYDVAARRIAKKLAVGGSQISPGRPFECIALDDSLLVLQGVDWNRGLARDGVDDDHRYLVAYRPDGTRAWVRMLCEGYARKMFGGVGAGPAGTLYAFLRPANFLPGDSSFVEIYERATGRRVAARHFPGRLQGLFPVQCQGDAAHYLAPFKNGDVTLFDSALATIRTTKIDVSFEMTIENSNWQTVDIDGDHTPDVLMITGRGQLVGLSGATLAPLVAFAADPALSLFAAVRVAHGPLRIVRRIGAQDDALAEIAPTPFLTRLGPHRAMLWTIAIVLLILPGAGFAVRRILYLRALFLQLSSRSESQGVVVVHRNGRVASANVVAARLLSFSPDASSTLDVLPGPLREAVVRAVAEGAPQTCNIVVPGAEPRYLSAIVAPMRATGGRQVSLITLADVTAFVDAELRRNLLSVALATGHDAKNKLGAVQLRINAIIEYLRREHLGDPAWLARQESAAGDSIDSVRDELYKLLYTATIAENNACMTDLAVCIREWIAREGPRYARRGIALQSRIGDDLPELNLETRHLGMLLSCACENAEAAMLVDQADKCIHFSAEVVDGAVALTIADTGCGMDHATLQRIEQPYFTTKSTGTGLGMMIMRKVCNEHGAHFTIDSAPHEGTRLTIAFPITQSSR